MQNDAERKTCPMCCSEIPAKAKKCPQCLHLQWKLNNYVWLWPTLGMTLMMIPLVAAAFAVSAMFDMGESYEPFKDQIVIVESEVAFGETKTTDTVAVLGTVRNNSPIGWKDVLFQVEFWNAEGKRIDTDQKREHPLTVPASEIVPFKISIRREFPKEQCAKHTVRIVNARDARGRW